MKNENFRSKVFKRANYLFESTGKSWPVCLSLAWALYRLTRDMRTKIVLFAFEKKDGSFRRAKGTLKDTESKVKGTGSFCPKTVCFYDVDNAGWRSFNVSNFITTYQSVEL